MLAIFVSRLQMKMCVCVCVHMCEREFNLYLKYNFYFTIMAECWSFLSVCLFFLVLNFLCVVGHVSIIITKFWSPLGGKKSVANLLKMLPNGTEYPLLLVDTTMNLHPVKEMGFSEIELNYLYSFFAFSPGTLLSLVICCHAK